MSVDPQNGSCLGFSFWFPELAATFVEVLYSLVMTNKYVNTVLLRW